MSNFTFLSQEEIFNEEQKLEVIKKRGTKTATTDFSILLGGLVSNSTNISLTGSLEGRTGYYWTKSDNNYNNPRVVDVGGGRNFCSSFRRDGGARLEYKFENNEIPTNGGEATRAEDGLLEVEYGYYPQKVASKDKQSILESEFQKGNLTKSGNIYTTDSKRYDEYIEPFCPQQNEEYIYEGRRYVRIKANSYYDGSGFVLSNGEIYKDGDNVWVEVMPVKWIVDENAHTMVADKLIFAGVRFNGEKVYKEEDFNQTSIKGFIDTYISKEILQDSDNILEENENKPVEECYELPEELLDSIAMNFIEKNMSVETEENAPIVENASSNGAPMMPGIECEEAIVHDSQEAKESGDNVITNYDKIYNEYKDFLGKDYKIV